MPEHLNNIKQLLRGKLGPNNKLMTGVFPQQQSLCLSLNNYLHMRSLYNDELYSHMSLDQMIANCFSTAQYYKPSFFQ